MKKELPANKGLPKDQHHDLILRELDCAVIEYIHQKIAEHIEHDITQKGYSELKHFDTSEEYSPKAGRHSTVPAYKQKTTFRFAFVTSIALKDSSFRGIKPNFLNT